MDSHDWGTVNVKTEPGLDTADASWNEFGLGDKITISDLKTKQEKLNPG